MVDALIHGSHIVCHAMLLRLNNWLSVAIVVLKLFESGWVIRSWTSSGASLGHHIHLSLFLKQLISIQIVIIVSKH